MSSRCKNLFLVSKISLRASKIFTNKIEKITRRCKKSQKTCQTRQLIWTLSIGNLWGLILGQDKSSRQFGGKKNNWLVNVAGSDDGQTILEIVPGPDLRSRYVRIGTDSLCRVEPSVDGQKWADFPPYWPRVSTSGRLLGTLYVPGTSLRECTYVFRRSFQSTLLLPPSPPPRIACTMHLTSERP